MDPSYIRNLRSFYAYMSQEGIKFFSSRLSKDVEKRFRKGNAEVSPVSSFDNFLTAVEVCDRNLGYLHIRLASRPGSPCSIYVIDVDSVSNAETVIEYCKSFGNESLPVLNKTPNGVHLFFLNTDKKRYRLHKKVLAMGVLADILPRGFVTILGEGYTLSFLSEIGTLPFKQAPLGLSVTNSTVGFFINGRLSQRRNLVYFLEHFDLPKKYAIKRSRLTKTFLECAAYLISHFPKDTMPLALQKLFSLFQLFDQPSWVTMYVPENSSSEEDEEGVDSFIYRKTLTPSKQTFSLGSIEGLNFYEDFEGYSDDEEESDQKESPREVEDKGKAKRLSFQEARRSLDILRKSRFST